MELLIKKRNTNTAVEIKIGVSHYEDNIGHTNTTTQRAIEVFYYQNHSPCHQPPQKSLPNATRRPDTFHALSHRLGIYVYSLNLLKFYRNTRLFYSQPYILRILKNIEKHFLFFYLNSTLLMIKVRLYPHS